VEAIGRLGHDAGYHPRDIPNEKNQQYPHSSSNKLVKVSFTSFSLFLCQKA
jgi:hypothetical protein